MAKRRNELLLEDKRNMDEKFMRKYEFLKKFRKRVEQLQVEEQ